MFRSYGARKFVPVVRVYKHLVPLGPEINALKYPDGFVHANFRVRTLEAYHNTSMLPTVDSQECLSTKVDVKPWWSLSLPGPGDTQK